MFKSSATCIASGKSEEKEPGCIATFPEETATLPINAQISKREFGIDSKKNKVSLLEKPNPVTTVRKFV
jgi:hypothetical protein